LPPPVSHPEVPVVHVVLVHAVPVVDDLDPVLVGQDIDIDVLGVGVPRVGDGLREDCWDVTV